MRNIGGDTGSLSELSFTVSARVAKTRADVYEAVVDPEQLSRYFTTGGARGRMERGNEVTWSFDDFPERFRVTVIDAEPPTRLVIEWESEASTGSTGTTTVVFTFESIDDDTRTLVTITETSWHVTPEGSKAAFGNCEGWTGMLAALKIWLEHGINLRDGFYR